MKTKISKILTLGVAMAMCSLASIAQTTYTGTVVDKNGQPVYGAQVTAKGAEAVTTGFDGTFTINLPSGAKKVSACYVGLGSEMSKAKDGMRIVLGGESWWTQKPKGQWFAGVQALFPERTAFGSINPGLTFGYVKNFGFYVKGWYMPEKDDEGYRSGTWFTGKRNVSERGALGGFIVRLGCPIYLYGGCGYMWRSVSYEIYGGDWMEADGLDLRDNVVVDAGLMLKYKHLLLNAGTIYNTGEYENSYMSMSYHDRFMVNVGVSYCF